MSQLREELLPSLQQKYDFVSMSDLERPTSEFMMRYFCTVLTDMGIDTKEMMQPKNLHNADFLKEYKDIFPYVQLRMIIVEVYPIPKYMRYFSILSLMEPKQSDIHFVDTIDNYYEYFDRIICDFLAPKLSRIAEIKEEIQQLEQKRAALKTHLSDLDAARGRRTIEQAKLDEQLIELSAREVRLTELQQLEAEDVDVDVKQQQELLGELQKLEELEEKYEIQRQYDLRSNELLQLQAKLQEQEQVLHAKRELRREKKSRVHLIEKDIEEESQTIREIEEVLAADSIMKEIDAVLQQCALMKESLQKELLKIESKNEEAAKNLIIALEQTTTIESSSITSKQRKTDVDRLIEELNLSRLKTNQELIRIQEKVKSATAVLLNKKESADTERNDFLKSLQELHEVLYNGHNRLKKMFSGDEP